MKKINLNLLIGLFLFVAFQSPLHAEPAAADKPDKADAKGDKGDAKADAGIFEEPAPSVTAHTITVGGKTIKYHATAGYIVLKEEEGKPLVPGQKSPPESKSDSKDE